MAGHHPQVATPLSLTLQVAASAPAARSAALRERGLKATMVRTLTGPELRAAASTVTDQDDPEQKGSGSIDQRC